MLVTDGIGVSLRCDLDTVGELHSKTEFGHGCDCLDTVPLGGLGVLEDHGQRGLVRETALAAHSAVKIRRKRAFDDVGRYADPVSSRSASGPIASPR
jgi:hypothetical protein